MPLPSLTIGPIKLGFPLVQAALSGYSDMAMRVIARRLGASYTVCEVMLDRFLVQVKNRTRNKHFMRIADEEHPVGGQLMGSDPEDFPAAARRLVEAGFDVIDINFGCPVKKVLGRCRGGFHLSQPRVAIDIVTRVRDAVPADIPVTVKMRRGIDDSAESRDNFFAIFDRAFQLGVAAITVHGRSVMQRYNGRSNWEFLREVKAHAGDHTVLGSGDLFTATACLDMIAQTGVDGVTVARGAIGNPWIFQQAQALCEGKPLPEPPRLPQQREIIAEHYRLSSVLYGPDRCGPKMRKFGIKYSQLHPRSNDVRQAFVSIETGDEITAVLDRWYADDLPGCYPREDAHRSQ